MTRYTLKFRGKNIAHTFLLLVLTIRGLHANEEVPSGLFQLPPPLGPVDTQTIVSALKQANMTLPSSVRRVIKANKRSEVDKKPPVTLPPSDNPLELSTLCNTLKVTIIDNNITCTTELIDQGTVYARQMPLKREAIYSSIMHIEAPSCTLT